MTGACSLDSAVDLALCDQTKGDQQLLQPSCESQKLRHTVRHAPAMSKNATQPRIAMWVRVLRRLQDTEHQVVYSVVSCLIRSPATWIEPQERIGVNAVGSIRTCSLSEDHACMTTDPRAGVLTIVRPLALESVIRTRDGASFDAMHDCDRPAAPRYTVLADVGDSNRHCSSQDKLYVPSPMARATLR